MKRSMLGLIEKELQELETSHKLHQRLLNGWKKQRNVKLYVSVPARLYSRLESLVEHLPDKEFQFELNDTFDMLADDILMQYGKLIDAKRLYAGLQAMQGVKKINNYEGESVTFRDEVDVQTMVTVSLPYKTVLQLEWIVNDVAEAVEEASMMTVEKMLHITFVNLAKRLQAGEVPNAAKLFSSHARGGVTS